MHCPSNQLCDRCLDVEVTRLRDVAEARGVEWARLVATHVVPVRPWPEHEGPMREHTQRRVSDLVKDKRLRDRLAEICAAAAARHWDELTTKR